LRLLNLTTPIFFGGNFQSARARRTLMTYFYFLLSLVFLMVIHKNERNSALTGICFSDFLDRILPERLEFVDLSKVQRALYKISYAALLSIHL
jgi:hypothetical protein